MKFPLVSILELNPEDMSVVMLALLKISRAPNVSNSVAERADALLDRVEAKLPNDGERE